MVEPYPRTSSRPTILFVVVALHVAVVALLLQSARSRHTNRPAVEPPLQLLSLPPTKTSMVHVENVRPQQLSTNIAIAVSPLALNSSPQTGAGSASDGRGSAVNWTAEAHRAVRAFEIRRNQGSNSALSVSSSLDASGASEHHAGDRIKTESGDWIVWINADCYQVASWHSDSTVLDSLSPQTICRKPIDPAHND
jgi:hypothetical protein